MDNDTNENIQMTDNLLNVLPKYGLHNDYEDSSN